jgi:hypothetical protein
MVSLCRHHFYFTKAIFIETGTIMRQTLRDKIITVCNQKIATKGDNVGLSFYAFFANKNDQPELLMEVATWWIKTHQLDHFVKARVIKDMIERGD